MKLKDFTLVDSEGEKADVTSADEKSAITAWEHTHPGVKVVSIAEKVAC